MKNLGLRKKEKAEVIANFDNLPNSVKSKISTSLGKPLHREALRRLPLPEKVRIVVELQKIAAPILRARGEHPFVWDTSRSKISTLKNETGKEGVWAR